MTLASLRPHLGFTRAVGLNGTIASLILLVFPSIVPVKADDPDPRAVLERKGLTLSGKTFWISDEKEFLDRWNGFRGKFQWLVVEYDAITGVRQRRARLAQLDNQLVDVMRRIDSVNARVDPTPINSDSNSRAIQKNASLMRQRTALIDLRGSLQLEIAAARKRIPPRDRFEQRVRTFQDRRRLFLEQTANLAPVLDRIGERYKTLAADPEVKQALSALRTSTKTHYVLGPTDVLRKARREWDQSRRVVQ